MKLRSPGSRKRVPFWSPPKAAVMRMRPLLLKCEVPPRLRDSLSTTPSRRWTTSSHIHGRFKSAPIQRMLKRCLRLTISDVTLINSYNGIRTGPTENGRHRIMGVHGCVLRRGIFIDWTGDIGRIENVQFSSHFWAGPAFAGNWDKVFNYMQQNLEAFVFGRSDWEYVTNTFVFPAKTGYRFMETANGSTNGAVLRYRRGRHANRGPGRSHSAPRLLITNGEFDSHHIGTSTQVVIAPHSSGSVRFVNSAFWGPAEHNAVIQGDGFYFFLGSRFRLTWMRGMRRFSSKAAKYRYRTPLSMLVQSNTIRAMHLSKQECAISRRASDCAGTRSAIIRGNNGYYGVKIENQIGDKAIISDNEPYTESCGG